MAQRDQFAMSEDEVAAYLQASWRAHMATINPDGTPHVVPMSYVVLGGRLTFWTDPRSRKVANLRRDPRVTCLVEDGTQFAEFRAVQLYGRVVLGEDRETSVRVGLRLFERASGTLDDEMRATVEDSRRFDGVSALRVGIPIAAVGLVIMAWAAQIEPVDGIERLLTDHFGFVLAWLGLWYPLDQFFFYPLTYGRENRVLAMLRDAEVTVEPHHVSSLAAPG